MPTVQLFATCLGDLVFPHAVGDAEALLREAGFDVEFPRGQVCCGQPAFNSGHRSASRRVARTFTRAFSRTAPIVTPSGSCATMVSRFLPELVGCEPFDVWELSVFLDAQGIEPARRNEGRRIAYHDSCHMLRELRIADAPRRLLERSGAELVALPRADLCCGFGGTFSVRQPEVSVAMADDKLAGAAHVRSRRARQRRPGLPDAPSRSCRTPRRNGADRPSRHGARTWNRCGRSGVSVRRSGWHGRDRVHAGMGSRRIGTNSPQIVTFRTLTRARSSDIVEHEGGGWYPTLDLGGGARTWPSRPVSARRMAR